MEGRESNSEMKALSLIADFVKKFRFIEFTVHPADIPGDSPGKSSNISWAARKASERYSVHMRDDVIITVIDGTTWPGKKSLKGEHANNPNSRQSPSLRLLPTSH